MKHHVEFFRVPWMTRPLLTAAERLATPPNAMKHSRICPALLLAIPIVLSGCTSSTSVCAGPDYRWASALASISDAADTLHADVYVRISEHRGGGQAATHSLYVNVEAKPMPTTVLPLPSLFGHATGARIERADGSVVLQVPLHTESNAIGLIAFTVQDGIEPGLFDSVRNEILANHLFITIVVDDSVPALGRGAVAVVESYDWAKQACQ